MSDDIFKDLNLTVEKCCELYLEATVDYLYNIFYPDSADKGQ